MLRVIVVTSEYGAAANVGGPVNVTHKTFDLNAPEVEAFMNEKMSGYEHRSFVGIEVVQPKDRTNDE